MAAGQRCTAREVSAAEIERLKRARADGMTWKEIGHRFGIGAERASRLGRGLVDGSVGRAGKRPGPRSLARPWSPERSAGGER